MKKMLGSMLILNILFNCFYNFEEKKSDIDLMSKVFANGLGGHGLIPGRVISKTQKMVLDAILLNTQHYKVLIKGKVEQSKEMGSTLSNNL